LVLGVLFRFVTFGAKSNPLLVKNGEFIHIN
jgi:hypothetical protein